MIYWVLMYVLVTATPNDPAGGIARYEPREQEFHRPREIDGRLQCEAAAAALNEMRLPPGQRIEGARCEARTE